MTNWLRRLMIGTAVLGLLAMLPAASGPTVAEAQYSYGFAVDPEYAGGVVGADDSDVAMLIRYVGVSGTGYTAATTTVEVTADTITLLLDGVGDPLITAAATAIGCAGAAGVIDIDDAQCNTVGEVLSVIAYSATTGGSGWRAVALDALYDDQVYETGVSKRILTAGATSAAIEAGVPIYWDTSVQFSVSRALVPPAARSIAWYLTGNAKSVKVDPFRGTRALFVKGNGTSTYGAGTSTFNLYAVKDTYTTGGALSETYSTLYSEPAGATTVNDVFDLSPYGVVGPWGQKVVARIANSAACAAVKLSAPAFWFERASR